MSMVEKNEAHIKSMNKLIEMGMLKGNDAIMPVLADISTSLAVIADELEKMNRRETYSTGYFGFSGSAFIPDACKACPNHPSNGGSGICHCTLGSIQWT